MDSMRYQMLTQLPFVLLRIQISVLVESVFRKVYSPKQQRHQVRQNYAYVCSTIGIVCAISDQSKREYL